jgi:hypothetical protein
MSKLTLIILAVLILTITFIGIAVFQTKKQASQVFETNNPTPTAKVSTTSNISTSSPSSSSSPQGSSQGVNLYK